MVTRKPNQIVTHTYIHTHTHILTNQPMWEHHMYERIHLQGFHTNVRTVYGKIIYIIYEDIKCMCVLTVKVRTYTPCRVLWWHFKTVKALKMWGRKKCPHIFFWFSHLPFFQYFCSHMGWFVRTYIHTYWKTNQSEDMYLTLYTPIQKLYKHMKKWGHLCLIT